MRERKRENWLPQLLDDIQSPPVDDIMFCDHKVVYLCNARWINYFLLMHKITEKEYSCMQYHFWWKNPIESSNAYFFKDCYYISPEMFYGKFGVELSPIFYTPFPYCVLSLFSFNVRWHQSDIQVRISSSVAQHCLVYKLCYV